MASRPGDRSAGASSVGFLEKLDPEAVIGMFPADHVIVDETKFCKALLRAVEIAAQEENKTLKKVLVDLKTRVEGGEDFSAALSRHSKHFDKTYISLVKASEHTGTLGEMLENISDHLRKQLETRQKVKAAMAYPGIMFTLAVGVLGCVSFLLLAWRLPAGLIGAPVDFKTWVELARNPTILLLLLITTLQMSGQFVVFTFMGPLLRKLTDAGPDAVGLVFALYGVSGFIGVVIATRIVDSWGAFNASLLFTALVLTGVTGWALSAGVYPLMALSVVVWGLGFASTNSMQQVRLVAAAPPLAPASVSLNTSVLYVGQGLGSAIGGLLYARELLYGAGYVAAGFIVLALTMVLLSRPRRESIALAE